MLNLLQKKTHNFYAIGQLVIVNSVPFLVTRLHMYIYYKYITRVLHGEIYTEEQIEVKINFNFYLPWRRVGLVAASSTHS
jgi:hypothetical protein